MLGIVKKIAPFAAMALFVLIGIIGYSIEKSSTPVRVLFSTNGGDVVFQHEAHVRDYDQRKCQNCHHNMWSDSLERGWKCRSCHREGADYENICEDRAPHRQCIGANCIACHADLGIDPKECSFCHRK
ncbi:MAG: cytochrome c3 family protein [Spirochaetes bacterium]|nr:cytochrome c3 family protein [Spirochaetota bacterium]